MRAVAVLSLLLPGCLLDLTPGAATLIDCTRNDECPKDWICLDDVGRCAPAKDVLRLRPPARPLVAITAPAGQTQVKNGDVVEIDIAAGPDAHPSNVRVGSVELDVATFADVGDGHFSGLFVVNAAHGDRLTVEATVSRAEQASEIGASNALAVDLVPPRRARAAVTEGVQVTTSAVTLILAAVEATSMFIDGDVEDAQNVRTWIELDTAAAVVLRGARGEKTITVRFRDGAFNESQVTATTLLDDSRPVSTPLLESKNGTIKVGPSTQMFVRGGATGASAIESAALMQLDGTLLPIPGCTPTNLTSQVQLVGGSYSGTVANIGALCPGAAYVVLSVVAKNAAGATSLPEESDSNLLTIDTLAPSATLGFVAQPFALDNFVASPMVTLLVAASEPDGSPVEIQIGGDVLSSSRVGVGYVPYPGVVAGQEPIVLTGGDGIKSIQATFRDEVGNAATLASLVLQLDTMPPPPPAENKLRLVETAPAPDVAATIADGNNGYGITGISGAVTNATRVEISGGAPLSLLTTAVVAGDGSFLAPGLTANIGQTYSLIALDSAGNRSVMPTTITPPSFLPISVTPAHGRAGAPFQITFSSSVTLATFPTVTIDGQPAATGISGSMYQYSYTPTGGELQGRDVVVVRVSGDDGRGVYAPGTRGTSARVMTLDFTQPTLASGGVAIQERTPGLTDRIVGTLAATDNISIGAEMNARVFASERD